MQLTSAASDQLSQVPYTPPLQLTRRTLGPLSHRITYMFDIIIELLVAMLDSITGRQRKRNNLERLRKRLNPLILKDHGLERRFCWESRGTINRVKDETEPRQLLEFKTTLVNALREQSGLDPIFCYPDTILGDVVYELSSDFTTKWRLLGGIGEKPGDRVLVLQHPEKREA